MKKSFGYLDSFSSWRRGFLSAVCTGRLKLGRRCKTPVKWGTESKEKKMVHKGKEMGM